MKSIREMLGGCGGGGGRGRVLIGLVLVAMFGIFFSIFVFMFGEEHKDLVVVFMGSIMVGIFTLVGVNLSLKYNQRSNYGRFYLHFHKSQVSINEFIRLSDLISAKLSGVDRYDIRIISSRREFERMKEEIESTIKTINKNIDKVDFDNFVNDLFDINENAPIEYYLDLNSLIFSMVNIYNSLIVDSRYLVKNLPELISLSSLSVPRSKLPHSKQLSNLKKLYKKTKKKMKLKY